MKRIILIILTTTLLIGCGEENEVRPNYSEFFKLDYPTFRGAINNTNISWNYGLFQFQMTTGYQSGTGICNDTTDFTRIAIFGLMSDDNQKRVMLYSPIYDVKNLDWFKSLFKIGKRKLGGFREDFYLTVTRDGKFSETNNLNKGEIEILKTEEFINPFSKPSLRVWFSLDTELLPCNRLETSTILKEGLIIAEFWDYKGFK